ncbi:MAG: DUF2244 domain-containing protein [Bauldia sp.]
MTSANAPAEPPIYAATLRPHRSLGRRGLFALMAVLSAMSLTVGLIFWSIGAWPVPGFLGLDVLLVYAAFRLSYRQARAAEEIRLSRSALTVRRIAPDGTAAETGLNPYWARFEVDRHPEFGILGMAIAWQGHRLAIGRFLGAGEREKFAREFSAALAKARA